MGESVKVARKELGPGRAVRITVDGDDVALFQVGAEFFAVSNQCPHQHFSKIYQGSVDQGAVTCPMHGWTFDLKTGDCVTGSGRLKTYVVESEGTDLLVKRGTRR